MVSVIQYFSHENIIFYFKFYQYMYWYYWSHNMMSGRSKWYENLLSFKKNQ